MLPQTYESLLCQRSIVDISIYSYSITTGISGKRYVCWLSSLEKIVEEISPSEIIIKQKIKRGDNHPVPLKYFFQIFLIPSALLLTTNGLKTNEPTTDSVIPLSKVA